MNKGIKKVPTGDLDKDFQLIAKYAMKIIKEDKGLTPALFAIDSKEPKLMLISGRDFPYDDSDEKQSLFEAIGVECADKMPTADCFIFAAEAWMSIVDKNTNLKKVRAKDDPNRKEILIVSAKKVDGSEKYFTKMFERDKDGNVTFLDVDMGLNTEWLSSRKSAEEGLSTQNFLLNALWHKFLFKKIINENI